MTDDNALSWLAAMLPALGVSLQLTVVFVVLGIPYAVLLAVGSLQRNPLLRWPAILLVECGRGVPALVVIYAVYFGLPQIGMTLDAFVSAGVALAISYGSYASGAFQAGLQAVPVGQHEAAAALGLTASATFFRVILPQAVRIVAPPLIGWTIVFFQATSLAYAVSVPELLSSAYAIAASNFKYLYALGLAAVLYAAICIPFSLLVDRLERRQAEQR
jgi:polar amino acid transport system permease protein